LIIAALLGVEGGGKGGGGPGMPRVRFGSKASKTPKPRSYDHKFSGCNSCTAPPLQKLGWDRRSRHPINIHNGGPYKYIPFCMAFSLSDLV